MTRFYDARGSATLAGVFVVLILVLLAAALVDVYRIQDTRAFAYSAANDAALRGASFGRAWDRFTATGEMGLDPLSAENAAQSALGELLAARGIVPYAYEIQVLPDPGGGSVANFPPVARAELTGAPAWTEARPAVGVYLAIPVPTILFGFVNGNQPVTAHAFAAAGIVEVQ